MGDFFGRLLDWLREAWPFRTVEPWEDGFYLTFAQLGKRVGPGIWPVVPYFQEVKCLSIAEARLTTPMLHIMLTNGKQLAFSVSARVRVVDVVKALVDVGTYQETTGEEVAAFVADFLSEAPAERFETTRKRRNLIAEAVTLLNERTRVYGVEVIEIQFTNWILGVRAYRLLNDSALSPPSLTW